MTVTELRQALEKLEAEGKGGLPIGYICSEWWHTNEAEYVRVTTPADKPAHSAFLLGRTGKGPIGYSATDHKVWVEIG